MFDHISFRVTDLARSRTFYAAALAPLGIGVILDSPEWVAVGKSGRVQFWIGAHASSSTCVHLAFTASNRAEVREFHSAALAVGGTDSSTAGLRPQYNPHYYGAFVLDADGNNVETVCRNPED